MLDQYTVNWAILTTPRQRLQGHARYRKLLMDGLGIMILQRGALLNPVAVRFCAKH